MRHLQQPHKTNLCGQYCLSMILDQPIDMMVEELGRGKTNTRDLINCLTHYGMNPAPKLIRGTVFGQIVAILKVKFGKSSHWVVFDNELIFDPELTRPYEYKEWYQKIEGRGYVSSFLRVCGSGDREDINRDF